MVDELRESEHLHYIEPNRVMKINVEDPTTSNPSSSTCLRQEDVIWVGDIHILIQIYNMQMHSNRICTEFLRVDLSTKLILIMFIQLLPDLE